MEKNDKMHEFISGLMNIIDSANTYTLNGSKVPRYDYPEDDDDDIPDIDPYFGIMPTR